jgi:hypothetical protein
MPTPRKWTREGILGELRNERELSWACLRRNNYPLLSAAEKGFGSFRKAVEALGLDYDEIAKRKPQNKKWLIKEIHAFVASGDPVSTLYTSHSHLMIKSKRLFGSVPKAFKAAGYRYDDLKRSVGHASSWPTRNDLIRAIRRLPITYHETVRKRHRGLFARAERLFGSWRAAVQAAGLKRKIQRLRDKSLAANMHTRLYHAARNALGSWRYAVELAGFPCFEAARIFRWSPDEVLYYIRWFATRGESLNETDHPELHRKAVKYFGSWKAAVSAARNEPTSIRFKHKVKRAREIESNPDIAKGVRRALPPHLTPRSG